jgi:hypothetical protein
MPRSRSFTRLTMRVGLLHFGQSVDFVVSITFLRSPVLAILAMVLCFSFVGVSLLTRATGLPAASTTRSCTHLMLTIVCQKKAGLARFSLQQNTLPYWGWLDGGGVSVEAGFEPSGEAGFEPSAGGWVPSAGVLGGV